MKYTKQELANASVKRYQAKQKARGIIARSYQATEADHKHLKALADKLKRQRGG